MAQLVIIDDAAIYIYALSLLFYFSNCFRRNPGAKRMGAGLLACSMVLMLFAFGSRLQTEGVAALLSAYDYLQWVSFCLMLSSVFITFLPRTELAVLLVSLAGFVMLVANRLSFSDDQYPLVHGYTLHSMLTLHIVLAGVSFAALTLAAVFASMYLFLHHRLKTKKWSDTIRRLPSLEDLDSSMPGAVMWGVSLLSVSLLIAGVVMAKEGSLQSFLDLKVISTFVSLLVYLLYFIIRSYKRISGVSMAKWVLLGYAIVIVNFLSNSLSAFHSWNWR
ncbi:cytochrome c biogenesis protein CcsA [Paenibacillus caui]|uniref:cytochrome c biogenesis protein CcsA n=1 Tax=Paenibacillus caui TaxID=2873927 RepID=UPI001CA8E886|nr:cytochrome c biogenesis protein CcsA [Paenibacillus caui]